VIRTATVRSAAGLHARAAAAVAAAAARCPTPVTVRRNDRPAGPADSVLSLLTLAATAGTELILEATGPDAETSLDRMATVIESDLDVIRG
jgi:phosphocarrier protein HPr